MNTNARELYQRGVERFSRHRYEEAVALFKSSIHGDPAFVDAYLSLIRCYEELKQLPEARGYFLSLASADSDNPNPHYALGLIAQKEKNLDTAIHHFKKAIQISPSFSPAFRALLDCYNELQQLSEAEKMLAALRRQHPSSATVHYARAYLFSLQKQKQQALSEIDEALRLNPALLDAILLKTRILSDLQKRREALRVAHGGLSLALEKGSLSFQCRFLGTIGEAYFYLYQLDSAGVYCERALRTAQKIGDRAQEAQNLSNLGAIYRERLHFDRSLQFFKRALALAKQMGLTELEGRCYRNIGTVYYYLFDHEKALDYYRRAQKIFLHSNDERSQALVLWSMGLVYWNRGHYEEALDSHRRAYELARRVGDKWGQERYLGALGLVLWNLGRYAEALEAYSSALQLAEEIGDRQGQSILVGNIAILYGAFGDRQQAIRYYQKALAIARETGNLREESRHLGNLAINYFLTGKYEAAYDYLRQAILMARRSGEKVLEADFLGNLAQFHLQRGDLARADSCLEKALEISRSISAKWSEGQLWVIRGHIALRNNDFSHALRSFRKALDISERIFSPQITWKAYSGMAAVHEQRGRFLTALRYYQKAIDEIEKIRTQVPDERSQMRFVQDKFEIYENTISLLARLNEVNGSSRFDRMAFLYAEKAKARTLLDRIITIRGNALIEGREQVQRRERMLGRKIQEIRKRLNGAPDEKEHSSRLIARLRDLDKTRKGLQAQIQTSVAFQSLPAAHVLNSSAVQTRLTNDRSAIVEFSLGRERSFAWLISKDRFQMVELPAEEKIRRLVLRYRRSISRPISLSNPFSKHLRLGFELYQQLLEPIVRHATGLRELIIVPDGILFLLPFESLVVQREEGHARYLIEKFAIDYLPSSSILSLENRANAPAKFDYSLLALGDPVFASDSPSRKNESQPLNLRKRYYQRRGFHFFRLPFSRREIETIGALFEDGEKSVLAGGRATKNEFLQKSRASSYRYMHLATHAFIDEKSPPESAIVFSSTNGETQNELLRIDEIMNLRLRTDLVVLSGCQTGLGELIKGEGIVGLGWAFLMAGAPSLVVSLWNISDRSTAEFMSCFYRHLLQGEAKNQALRNAKLEMLRSARPAYRHPFYWAPFVLYGNSQ